MTSSKIPYHARSEGENVKPRKQSNSKKFPNKNCLSSINTNLHKHTYIRVFANTNTFFAHLRIYKI